MVIEWQCRTCQIGLQAKNSSRQAKRIINYDVKGWRFPDGNRRVSWYCSDHTMDQILIAGMLTLRNVLELLING